MSNSKLKRKAPVTPALNDDRIYFTRDTEQWVTRYNQTIDPFERDRIYAAHLQKPLEKMAENIINRFKFPYIPGTFQDVKDQVVSYLALNLHKYSEAKGKAFSYFSVIAKNYLILHNSTRYKHEKRSFYFSDGDGSYYDDALMVDGGVEESKQEAVEFVRLMCDYWDHNLTRVFKKRRDQDVANAIVQLFRRADGVENFNKKALYLMVREMTGQKTTSITKIVNKMAEYVVAQQAEFQRTGTIKELPTPYFKYPPTASVVT